MNRLDRSLSIAGIALCILGWVSLISGSVVETGSLLVAGRALSQRDVMMLGQSALITGSMLIFLASMRSGFGALDRFFNAALERSNRSGPRLMAEAADMDIAQEGSLITPTATMLAIDGRSCARLADGSIVIETLLGARRFASEADAREFITLLPTAGEPLRA